MRLLPCVGLLLGLWSAQVSGAQSTQEPPRGPILSVETHLVTLVVTVVDRHGGFVPGLAQERFRVYDNGERRPIELFSSEDLPATVGLLIDSSSSMRGRRDDVTAAGAAFATFSHPRDELFTVNFNEHVWPGLPSGVAFAKSTNQLRTALAVAPARGKTALYDAVDVAIDHVKSGTHARKILVIVSDGGDNASTMTLNAVVDRARRSSAVIYAVMLVDPDNRDARPDVLKKLARETGGEAFAPSRGEDVTRAFTQIAREIRSGYLIGFSPPDVPDSGFRRLTVIVDGDGRQLVARTRAGYHAGRLEQEAP